MDKYTIAVGRSRTDKEWKNSEVSWKQLEERLSVPVRTPETMDEYRKARKDDRLKIKDVGGFVGGPLKRGSDKDGRRTKNSFIGRGLMSIDIEAPAQSGRIIEAADLEKIYGALDALGCAYIAHSTHSSRPDNIRIHVIIPLSRLAEEDEYAAATLKVSDGIGFDYIDPTCVQTARLMFWPSIPKDAEYIFRSVEGEALDLDTKLAEYIDWRDASQWPGASEGMRRSMRRKGITGTVTDGRLQDPTMKGGWVGAFCKVYSIDDAITAFGLPYRKTGNNRYTYEYGSSQNGAVCYDDRWLYSNHATDPCSLQCCNAFDLVRIHKFGDLDATSTAETPVNRLQSYARMEELCAADKEVSTERAKQQMAGFEACPVFEPSEKKKDDPAENTAFEAVDIFADEEPASPEKDASWILKADRKKSGEVIATPNTYTVILKNDRRFQKGGRSIFAYDAFSLRKSVIAPLPWSKEDERFPHEWSDADTSSLTVWMSENYQLHTGKSMLQDAVDTIFTENTFHPVRSWLESLPEWDGVKRAEKVFIDFLGCEDNELNRTISRKHLTAAVKRVFEPGCKYDQVLVFVGPEGVGKSEIIKRLAHGWSTDSAIPVGEKDAYQNLPGNWLIEMGELSDYETKSSSMYKNFIAASIDKYRPSYGRETISVPRQCVLFGTTNEDAFLKGLTGNRRFWVMETGERSAERLNDIFSGKLDTMVPLIWAEAYHYYKEREQLTLPWTLELQMRELQDAHNNEYSDDNRNIIEDYILTDKPAGWTTMSTEEKRDWYHRRGPYDGTAEKVTTYRPEYTCVKEIALVVYGQSLNSKSKFEDRKLKALLDRLDCLQWINQSRRFGDMGNQRAYRIIRPEEELTLMLS